MQLPISTDKIANVIIRARKFDADMPDGSLGRELRAFIAALNDDEKAALTAVMWIGRGSFDASEFADAYEEARGNATTPTEDYLLGVPLLADYLEDGLNALGIDPGEMEEEIFPTV